MPTALQNIAAFAPVVSPAQRAMEGQRQRSNSWAFRAHPRSVQPRERFSSLHVPAVDALSGLRTGHGCCGDMLHKWGMRDDPQCDCGHSKQILRDYPIRAYPSTIDSAASLSPEFLQWLEVLDVRL